jgi:purine catabolism regulator
MLTLKDLLVPRGLSFIVGGPEDLERPVEGIHSTDHPHPGDWIEENWVVLTNGGGVRNQPALQRELVANLDEAGAVALGLGIGTHFKRPPRALVAEARQRGLPLFAVPLDVSFVDMVRDVYQSTFDDDARNFVHLVAIQHHLLDALGTEDPPQALVDRLGSDLEATVAVVGPEGQVPVAGGVIHGAPIWELLHHRRPMPIEIQDESGWVVAVPIFRTTTKRAERWLVARRRDRFPSPRTAKRTLQIAAPLFAAVSALRFAATVEERSLRAGLLRSILECEEEATAATLAVRAAAFGIAQGTPARIIAIAVAGGDAGPPLVEAINLWLEERGVRGLCAAVDGRVLLLVQRPDAEIDEFARALLGTLEAEAVAGIGRPVARPHEVSRSGHDAIVAVGELLDGDGEEVILRYERFDLDMILFSEVSRTRVGPQLQELLAPLEIGPDLWGTIEAYFDNELDAPATAEALHLHPNTLRYRLGRVEELIGRSLRSPATIAALQFALRERRSASPPES